MEQDIAQMLVLLLPLGGHPALGQLNLDTGRVQRGLLAREQGRRDSSQ